jgi:acetolactate synthase regulatory subunit
MGTHPVVPEALRHGPFSLAEARWAGVSRRQLQGASWRRLGFDTFIWVKVAQSPSGQLAAIRRRLPPEAVFAGKTAAWLHGLDVSPCDPVTAIVPRACGVSARAGVTILRRALDAGDVVDRRGMRVTSIARTLADLASELSQVEAVVVADMALHARLLNLDQLWEWATARPRRGVARLRRLAELAEPASESRMETRLRMLLVGAGLPRPEAQVDLHDERGRFVGRADLFYRAARLAIEYDGGTHRHSLVEDDRRQNLMLQAGIALLRFTAPDLRRPAAVVAQVGSALGHRQVHRPAG